MSEDSGNPVPALQQAGDALFDYAVDREDLKWLLARLPSAAAVAPAKVEYELQLLKIISVGWSIVYYMPAGAQREALSTCFWQAVQRFSHSLSETTGLLIGQDIDYFQTLKDRLDTYVRALNDNPGTAEPARVIGPEFARLCGDARDLSAFMAGSKMFMSVLQRVGKYLQEAGLAPPGQ